MTVLQPVNAKATNQAAFFVFGNEDVLAGRLLFCHTGGEARLANRTSFEA